MCDNRNTKRVDDPAGASQSGTGIHRDDYSESERVGKSVTLGSTVVSGPTTAGLKRTFP